MQIRTIVTLVLGVFSVFATAATPINDKNWLNHPEVVKIRALYADTNAAEKSKVFSQQSRQCTLYHGSVKTSATVYRDQNRVIRKYIVNAGTGDTMGNAEYYYDLKGTPRFTYKTFNAANGTKQQDRIYFNVSGIHLYTNHRQEGAGYPQGGLEDVVRNPAVHYAQLCEE